MKQIKVILKHLRLCFCLLSGVSRSCPKLGVGFSEAGACRQLGGLGLCLGVAIRRKVTFWTPEGVDLGLVTEMLT